MAYTFPLAVATFADVLKVAKVSFRLRDNQEISGLGSGDILAAQLTPRNWIADVTLAKLTHNQAKQIQAMIEALDGSINTFLLTNTLALYPQSDPTGAILGANTVVIASLPSAKSMTLSGLPAGYVLTLGDMLSYTYSSTRRALLRISETVTANGSGITPAFEVRPWIPTGTATSTAVTLKKPAGKFIMVPNTFDVGSDDNYVTTSIKFTAMEKKP